MIKLLSYNTLLLAMLVSCTGCKKQTDEANPTTQIPSCLISTQTTKELVKSNQTLLDPETITIGTESFQVSTTKKSVYSYDIQGRILTEYNTYPDNKADSVLYQYTSTSVTIRTIALTTTPRTTQTQVVALNSQGLAEDKGGAIHATYDRDGYLLTQKGDYLTYTINNGNIIESLMIDSDAGPSYTTQIEYDLSKSGLPSIQSFYGKESRNLRTRYTIQQNGPFNVYHDVYTGSYVYIFNDDASVKRQIYRGKDGEIGYIYGGSKLTVKDLTYTCPKN